MNNQLMYVSLETQKAPEFKEVRGKDWVYYGEDNCYPDYLIGLYERSATHNAIVNGKVQYITGEGVTYRTKGVNTITRARIEDFLQKVNPDEDIEELLTKITFDFELFNGFYFEVIRSKSGNSFTLNHIPFNKMRTNADMSRFWYSNNWKNERGTKPEETGFKEFPAFDPEGKESRSIYYYKIITPRAGKSPNVYPLPTYVGATQAIETEIETINYGLSEIKTGFSAGTMITFNNGIPTPDEQKEIKRQIKKELTGSEGTGFILSFADSKDRGSEVMPLNGNDLPERYMNVRNSSMKTIFTGHRVSSPSLFGVQQENVTFGTRAEIAEQYEVFQSTYISGRQKHLEKVFNDFAKLKGINPKITIRPTKAIETDIFSEATIVQHLPTEAIREMVAERLGVDLFKYNQPKQPVQMSKDISEDELDSILMSMEGVDKSEFEVINSRPFLFDEDFDIVEMKFEDDKQDPLITPPSEIKKDIPKKDLGKIEVVYSYEWRPEFIGSNSNTSRPFCKQLIEKKRFYTREEISRLRNEFGSSVWKYKGGWYTKSDGSHVPYCRHWWMANLVRRK